MVKKNAFDGDAFKKLVSVVQFLFLAIAGWATTEIRSATDSINKLNITMAQLLNEASNQKELISNLDMRVHELEVGQWGRSKYAPPYQRK